MFPASGALNRQLPAALVYLMLLALEERFQTEVPSRDQSLRQRQGGQEQEGLLRRSMGKHESVCPFYRSIYLI